MRKGLRQALAVSRRYTSSADMLADKIKQNTPKPGQAIFDRARIKRLQKILAEQEKLRQWD